MSELLGQVLGRVATDTGSAGALEPVWRQVVGPVVSRHTRCAQLAQGALTVACDSAHWRDELSARAGELLERLRAAVGPAAPHALVFRLDGEERAR